MSGQRDWVSAELSAVGDTVATWAAQVLREDGCRADSLCVVTPDGGVREALAFWADAQRTGFAFANPGPFPWTLANSIAGRVTQELGIHGACTTYVGGAKEVADALSAARDDIAAGLAAHVLVLYIRGDSAPGTGDDTTCWRLTAWLED